MSSSALAETVTARGTGAWELPHLDAGGCPVRFTRGLWTADYATLGALAERRRGAVAIVFVDEGVAAGRPELLDEAWARGMSPIVVPGGHAIRHGAAAVADIGAAVEALAPDRGGLVVAVGGAAMLESVDQAVAASGRELGHVWVPTTTHGLVAALEPAVLTRARAVLTDFELLRSLSDPDWYAGITPAIEAALAEDRAFFWWLERQAEELWHRSLPAMAWVVYRTAQLCLSRPHRRLGVPLRSGGVRRGQAAGAAVALGVTCSRRAGRLPYLEWRRVIDLLERLELPVWSPDLATPAGSVVCGMIERIGSGVSAERLDAASVSAAAAVLRDQASRCELTPPATSCTRPACPPSQRRTRGR